MEPGLEFIVKRLAGAECKLDELGQAVASRDRQVALALLLLGAVVWLLIRRADELAADVQGGWDNGERTLSDHWKQIDHLENRASEVEKRCSLQEAQLREVRARTFELEQARAQQVQSAPPARRGFLNRLVGRS